ncbi:hypothetical protein MCOR25_007671 [Pyricularia grisea]|nr:hypothetical protein MCOR25_007671 [Pyricularia grisea]
MGTIPSTRVTVTATYSPQEQQQGGKVQALLYGSDAQQWQGRFNTAIADFGGVFISKAPASAEPFFENLFGRIIAPRKNAAMEEYQTVNATEERESAHPDIGRDVEHGRGR